MTNDPHFIIAAYHLDGRLACRFTTVEAAERYVDETRRALGIELELRPLV
jgi:hypothetical protein